MKTLQKTILALAITFTTTYSFAQTAYEKAMLPKVQMIEMPKANPDDYTAQANDFARIGDKEKTLWQPYYYAALSIIKKGRELMQKNQVAQLDDVAKEAQNYIDKAEALSPNNAEIFLLKKMNHGLKMMVNPMERWQTEGQAAQQALAKAKELDPENPRISILEAEDLYYTPEQFGGSKSKGIELFKKALEQFKTYKIKSSVDPNWGQGEANYFISQAK
ncbi:hypothetical protein GCM10010992_12440 [Cloacibacterium rupense]|uniref:TPR repeat-containing protein n=1 Tax=Cloacibacterium rupense TaxID=517423 RepID=A0ABQ2NHL6_9FLAO|nr:hypothetical protein [Cloacibacterium rupense]GGP03559.1 hypothetical protein GCM10010992_12440 [Cloacibacterium rupense]